MFIAQPLFAGEWIEIDHPYDDVKMEILSDDNSSIMNLDIFYTRFTIDKKWMLSQFIVDCSNETYAITYRQSIGDKFANLSVSDIGKFDPTTMIYYPLNEYCSTKPKVCFSNEYEEDLERTQEDEMLSILTKEMEINDGTN